MAVFEYKGLSDNGKQVKGIVDAESLRTARYSLKQKGIFPTELNEAQLKPNAKEGFNVSIDFSNKKVSTFQLAITTRQLSTLISAGMPLVEALRSLSEQTENTRLKSIVAEVSDQVNEGSTFADGLKEFPRVFPRLYVNMVASGEASGTLDMVLERLADLLEGQAILKRKVISALFYPIIMIVLCMGIVALLLTFVVPQITAIFEKQGAVLPVPTRLVIFVSDVFQTPAFWILGVGGVSLLAIFYKKYTATERGRYRVDKIKLKLPLAGPIILKVGTSRLSRNLGTMLESGIQLLNALSISKNLVGNAVLEEAVEKAAEGVREGKSLAKELEKANVFPKLLIHMSAIGEKTGALDDMLKRAAASYESEVEALITGLTSILEPILIIMLAGIVGTIIASVMLPMLELTSFAGL